jgi:hypothetical protein
MYLAVETGSVFIEVGSYDIIFSLILDAMYVKIDNVDLRSPYSFNYAGIGEIGNRYLSILLLQCRGPITVTMLS